jgi:hypothetical protein
MLMVHFGKWYMWWLSIPFLISHSTSSCDKLPTLLFIPPQV